MAAHPPQPLRRPFWQVNQPFGDGAIAYSGAVNGKTKREARVRARELGITGRFTVEQYPDKEYCKEFPENCKGVEGNFMENITDYAR